MAYRKQLSLLLLPAIVAALPQTGDTSEIPNCAYPGILSTVSGTGCSLSNLECVCGQTDIIPALTKAVIADCGDTVTPDDITGFIQGFCGDLAPVATTSAPAATTSAPAETSPAPSTTEAPVSMTDAVIYPTTTVPAIIVNGTTNGTNTTGTWTSSTPTPSTVPSEGGAPSTGFNMMALAVALGGMSWVFAEL